MQENWIGKSEGVRFAFPHDIRDADGELIRDGRLYVFTTRADTIMGVTFCAVAPEHPLAVHAAAQQPGARRLHRRVQDAAARPRPSSRCGKRKASPDRACRARIRSRDEPIEVWVGNYVLMGYGDGAVMGVPAHDERDFAFAKKYGIADHPGDRRRRRAFLVRPLAGLVRRQDARHHDQLRQLQRLHVPGRGRRGRACAASEGAGRKEDDVAAARLGHQPAALLGHADPDHPLRAIAAPVPVPESDLPVVLPEDLIPDGSGNPLNRCARVPGRRVPDAAASRRGARPTPWTPSSIRRGISCATATRTSTTRWSARGTQYWMPMDQYIGGIEHAILHLLYARFWTKVMRDLGLVKIDEPFTRLLTQGMVLNHIYSRRNDKGGVEYFWPHEVDNVLDADGHIVGAHAEVRRRRCRL